MELIKMLQQTSWSLNHSKPLQTSLLPSPISQAPEPSQPNADNRQTAQNPPGNTCQNHVQLAKSIHQSWQQSTAELLQKPSCEFQREIAIIKAGINQGATRWDM